MNESATIGENYSFILTKGSNKHRKKALDQEIWKFESDVMTKFNMPINW